MAKKAQKDVVPLESFDGTAFERVALGGIGIESPRPHLWVS